MRYVIGVDAGGTSTRAALLDETGEVVGRGRSGAGNPTSAGYEVAMASLVDACRQAIDQGQQTPVLVMLTLAGGLGQDVASHARAALAEAGMPYEVGVAGDVESAYFSATASPDGYLILSGTGATGARIAGGRLDLVSDGIGWLLGDEGSGFWLGHQVVRAAAAAAERRGPDTALLTLALDVVGHEQRPGESPNRRPEIWDLMRWVYARRPVECAGFAPLALRAAADGDAVAQQIIDRAAAGLLATCRSIVADDGTPLVLAGGLLHEGSPLAVAIEQAYAGRCLRAADGTAGAALLALRAIGAEADDATLVRIRQSLADSVRV